MRDPHPLTPINRTNTPERGIYFDAESYTEIDITAEEVERALAGEKVWKPHHPYLICAEFWDYRRGKSRAADYFAGDDFLAQFWADVDEFAPVGRTLHMFAHNAKYDVQVLAGVYYLVDSGWRVTSFSDENPFILRMEKTVHKGRNGRPYKEPKTKTLEILSSTNYYQQSLASLGKTFGIRKLDFPHGTVIDMANPHDRDMALLYCRTDVRILAVAMKSLFDFIEEEQLGRFQPTIAGQAFQAFRSRFLESEEEIYIHSHPDAIAVERLAYAGGRNECFRMGKIEERVYVNDVNSMYPYVMSRYVYPSRFVSFSPEMSIQRVEQLLREGYLICCDALVETPEPIFHLKAERLVFPVGEFWTALSTPELVEAFKRGYLRQVKNVAIYEGKPIFREYVEYMYRRRLAAKKAKDKVRDLLFKMFLNCLYGKFGQKNEKWEPVQETDPYDVDLIQLWDPVERKMSIYKVFGGWVFEKHDDPDDIEATNSFPAIAAHVTANARMLLWRVFEAAGRENVYYCDTDSVFTNRTGYERLCAAGWIDDRRLGALAMEKQGKLILNGCKDYLFYALSPLKLGKKQKAEIRRTRELSRKLSRTLYAKMPLRRAYRPAGAFYVYPRTVIRGEHFARQEKIKGVSKSAKLIGTDERGRLQFAITQWSGFSERFREKTFRRYANQVIVKTLKREYKKGIVSGSYVYPFRITVQQQEALEAKLEARRAAREVSAAKARDTEVDPVMRACRALGFIQAPARGEVYFREYMNLPRMARVKYFRLQGVTIMDWCKQSGFTPSALFEFLKLPLDERKGVM